MSYIYKVKSFSTQKPKDHITLSYFNFRRMCESWKLSDSLLTVCCRCGFVSVDSLLSRGRWEQVRCRPNPGTPIKINLVLSLVLSRLSGGLGMSLYSPTVYNPPPQLSSPWIWLGSSGFEMFSRLIIKCGRNLILSQTQKKNCFDWNHKTT